MSVKLMAGALDLKIPSGQKFVLTVLCNFANDDGLCYPGQDTLMDKCSMGRTTVGNHLKWLEERGYLRKNRRQKGNMRKSDLYLINLNPNTSECSDFECSDFECSDFECSDFGSECSDFEHSECSDSEHCYKEEPSETYNRQREQKDITRDARHSSAKQPDSANLADRPSENPPAQSARPAKRKPSAARRELDALNLLADRGVEGDLAQDYLAVRKDKRAATLTKTALAGLEREANRAGLSLTQAITLCCERGWVGFRADWLQDKHTRERAAGNGHTSHFFGNEYFENADYGDEIGEIR